MCDAFECVMRQLTYGFASSGMGVTYYTPLTRAWGCPPIVYRDSICLNY